MYFRNSQARRLLPMPAWPVIETRRVRRSRAGGVEEVLEQAQLLVAADERRLEGVATGRARRARPRRAAPARPGPAPPCP